MTDFYGDDEVKAVYYPEVEHALKEATGADRVFIFDYTMRRRISGAEDDRTGLRQPVVRVHVDHTAKSLSNGSATCCPRRPMNDCRAVSKSSTCGGRSAVH